MNLTRIIPCLLLKNRGLVKTVKFKNPVYVGDPINAVKIFNEKEVDELIFLDIEASRNNTGPSFDLIEQIASELFTPFCYGGGIKSVAEAVKILSIGAEKVAVNASAITNPLLIGKIADSVGNQSVVAAIDVVDGLFGKKYIYDHVKHKATNLDPLKYAVKLSQMGAGELFVNSVTRDGTMKGYDIDLLRSISSEVDIPVIASGGAGSLNDITDVFAKAKVSAAAAGSLFVFIGKHRGVLINYPSQGEISQTMKTVG